MSAHIKGLVLKSLKSTLYGQIVVSGETVQYYADAFGDKTSGIFLQSYQAEEDGSKMFSGQNISIELNIFAKGKSVDFVTTATEYVMETIKASLNNTLTIGSGYKATITDFTRISSFVEQDNGLTVHRDILGLNLRIDETN